MLFLFIEFWWLLLKTVPSCILIHNSDSLSCRRMFLKILKRIGMKACSMLSEKASLFLNVSRPHPFVFLLRLLMTMRVKHGELEEWHRLEKNLSQCTLSITVAWYPFTTKPRRIEVHRQYWTTRESKAMNITSLSVSFQDNVNTKL